MQSTANGGSGVLDWADDNGDEKMMIFKVRSRAQLLNGRSDQARESLGSNNCGLLPLYGLESVGFDKKVLRGKNN